LLEEVEVGNDRSREGVEEAEIVLSRPVAPILKLSVEKRLAVNFPAFPARVEARYLASVSLRFPVAPRP
jgi:hypothetical protein